MSVYMKKAQDDITECKDLWSRVCETA